MIARSTRTSLIVLRGGSMIAVPIAAVFRTGRRRLGRALRLRRRNGGARRLDGTGLWPGRFAPLRSLFHSLWRSALSLLLRLVALRFAPLHSRFRLR